MTTRETESGRRQLEFVCHAPEAKTVYLAGSFNGWDPNDTLMARSRSGDWRATLPLSPGRYEYKFVIDGRWVCDAGCSDAPSHRCPVCVTNAFGTMNKVVEVA